MQKKKFQENVIQCIPKWNIFHMLKIFLTSTSWNLTRYLLFTSICTVYVHTTFRSSLTTVYKNSPLHTTIRTFHLPYFVSFISIELITIWHEIYVSVPSLFCLLLPSNVPHRMSFGNREVLAVDSGLWTVPSTLYATQNAGFVKWTLRLEVRFPSVIGEKMIPHIQKEKGT